MTKLRPPLTIENALFRVLGTIGLERAAEVTGRGADYLRSVSDPDNRYRLTIADALTLDLEHVATGGAGFPIYETYGLLLEAARAERFSDAAAIARRAIRVIKEGGEAHAALVAASQPGATDADRAAALRELEEAACELTAAMALLRPTGQGP